MIRILIAASLLELMLLILHFAVMAAGSKKRLGLFVDLALGLLAFFFLCVFRFLNHNPEVRVTGLLSIPFMVPFYLQIAFLFAVTIWCIAGSCMVFVRRKNTLNKDSVIEAVNNMECGLLYSDSHGKIVLANRKMMRLVRIFSEKRILDADELWRSIISFEKNDRAKRIDFTMWPAFLLKNGEVWSFQRSYISDSDKRYMEIVARNVTTLYGKRIDTENSIGELSQLQSRLGEVLKNISEGGNEEELLNYKIRIHDQLGNAILRTRQLLRTDSEDIKNAAQIFNVWDNTIKAFKNNRLEGEHNKAGSVDALYKQAKTLGIDLVMFGSFPICNEVAVRAVREAMYNSIRHAYANTLTVESYKEQDGYHVRIYDDGKCDVKTITEGGGLKALRRAVEELGGQMNVVVNEGVELILYFKEVGRND